MFASQFSRRGWITSLFIACALPVAAQSLRVQCPTSTTLHPAVAPTADNPTGANPGIKCQEISGGDGYATMGDGTQTYLFGFGPLSGMDQINQGKPGTQSSGDFNKAYNSQYFPGVDANSGNALVPDPTYNNLSPANSNGAVMDPAEMMNVGVLAAQQPAPMMAIDEDDEFFLTLSNVGMIMRPDLFEQHTVHFHGYPNASSYFDGVPDASVAINISGSMTYYYTAPDAGTYFFHCHITPPEHLQMGMVGQLYVRPRQNRLPAGASLYAAAAAHPCAVGDILCTSPPPAVDTGATQPANGAMYAYNDGNATTRYDVEYPLQMMGFDPTFHFVGMTFNPEDFSGMQDKYFMLSGRSYPDTVNAGIITTQASDGLARPSQVQPTLITIDKTNGQTRALLRISNLNITQFNTLATIGIPMHVIAIDARLLRDAAGNDLAYDTNSVTLGGGSTVDVILDATNIPLGTYFLYTTNLDHLSNDKENFGGMMTEIAIK
ncbi:MAG: multicopper oxidase domain-containing protein [Gammaproteobacteria bacterium]|nr:multicopper oxidase domain-containing protein [Gammaproteobacteria bacterium]